MTASNSTGSLSLQFSKDQLPLPFGIVAANLLLKSGSLALQHGPHLHLSVNDDRSGKPHTIHGQSNIMKFLCRSASGNEALSSQKLYPEQTDLGKTAAIDQWLEKVDVCLMRGCTPKDLMQIAESVEKTEFQKFLVIDQISLADLAVWSLFKSHDRVKTPVPGLEKQFGKFGSWFKVMNENADCVRAEKTVNELVPVGAAVPKSAGSPMKPLELPEDGNVMNFFRRAVATEIVKVAPGFEVSALEAMLESPKGQAAEWADLCIPIPRLRLKGNPAQLAEEFSKTLQPTDLIEKISATGPFLNFILSKKHLHRATLMSVAKRIRQYGTNDSHKGKTAVVEFSSPNIAKPFHAGHLRSTIIGNFVRNVLKANGMKTIAINYLGDWGKQYGLLAVGYKRFGSEEELTLDPIRHLFDIYVRINKEAELHPEIHDEARSYFKKMEDGDQEALGLWKRFRDLSIVKYKQIYARLNIEFDIYSGESEYSEGMKEALEHLKQKQLLVESDGAQIIDLKPYKLTPAIVQKADGATLYITRDIAAAWDRHRRFNFDDMYYIVASQQDLHFQQLFKILELAEFDWNKKCHHINFGLVQGMSTRKGTVVFLEDILNEAESVMHDVMRQNEEKYKQIENPQEVADIIGLSAVVVQDLNSRRVRDYTFNWERMTSFEGDTGAYLQYAHARMCSIERKFLATLPVEMQAEIKDSIASNCLPVPFTEDLLHYLDNHPKVNDLVFSIAQFPDLVASFPHRQFEPCNLITYLMQLCHKVSSCLDDIYVMGQERNVAMARFWVYWAARVVVGNGMRLISLKPLERM